MFSLAALLLSATAFGQVESDDMYFTSKDRAALKAQKASEQSSYAASAKKPKKVEQATAEEVINPTDSYSARNVNPEFAARSNSQTAVADNQDYFMSNYKYTTAANLNKWNSNYNNYAGSPWYAPSYYGPSINEWGSPYGSSGYYNPWCSPYYSSGYSSSFSYYGGSSWNYGWGSGIGMGMSYAFGNPYMNSWGGYPGYGYGYGNYGYGGGYGYYPSTVVIINNGGDNGRNVVYGKRASHGGMVTRPQDASYTRSRTNYAATVRPTATNAGGRVSTSGTTTQRQEDYYNRSWRGSQQSYQQSQNNRSSSYDPWSNSNRSGTDSYNRDSNSSYSPSRSSSSDGGGSRQAAPASSGSNGRSRGRD